MKAKANATQRPRVFQHGKFMCATAGRTGAAALALIHEPGGRYERFVARLRALELLAQAGETGFE